ncbi:hypothetical protein K470DRAFT_173252 [Piedraia hortae CBS 480.64]|uniref:Uncharacterized protein n=1 Tax=Piedraia hortae CBS 480.64 TaxID=1314780 RepID=A0A6A7C666_9PEZI|nr:hypothetical protein K470DRAFT_173252 [Piedraia hortae CBS 480.64]
MSLYGLLVAAAEACEARKPRAATRANIFVLLREAFPRLYRRLLACHFGTAVPDSDVDQVGGFWIGTPCKAECQSL